MERTIYRKKEHLPGDPDSGEPGSVSGRGTRSHKPQLGVDRLQLKISCARTKTQCSQINKEIFFKKTLYRTE